MRVITLLTIAALSVLLMGVTAIEGCSQTSSKTGLDFSLESGIDKLSSGKTINLGDVFYISLKIENYDKTSKSGEVCVKDNMDNSYEGISEECVPFSVIGAEGSESESKSLFQKSSGTEPGVTTIIFPSADNYKYSKLPATQSAKLIITAKYSQSEIVNAPAGISVPEPVSEKITLNKEPSPVSISVDKSVTNREEGYKILLGIQLTKQQDASLYSPDFNDENYIHFSAEMMPQKLECVPEGTYDNQKLAKGLIELKSKKFISCSAFVYEEEQTWPLQIKLNYGVEIKKEVPFTIKV